MVDREKVIKGLEYCQVTFDHECDICPYRAYYEPLDAGDTCVADLYSDVLELLKEQEPVAPIMVPHSRGIAYNCGACGTEIAVVRDTVSASWQKTSVRYCQRCGRAVKW